MRPAPECTLNSFSTIEEEKLLTTKMALCEGCYSKAAWAVKADIVMAAIWKNNSMGALSALRRRVGTLFCGDVVADTGVAILRKNALTHEIVGVAIGPRADDKHCGSAAAPNYKVRPAAAPEAQAHWKLNPPSCPVTSTTSPMKKRPGTSRLSMVLLDKPSVLTPPAVTSALS